jgi:glycosyltransferase involved in cell wall biosynthesis
MRLLFVCRMFDQVAGGVERMAVNIMNAMADRRHDVTLFTWDLAQAEAFYPMGESIRWHRLDMGHAGQKANNLLRARRALEFRRFARSLEPDVVIGFQHGAWLFAEVGLLGCDVPVILAERNAPDRLDYTSEGHFRRAVFQSMRTAAAITVQSPSFVERYPPYLRSRIVVIPNPVYEAEGFAQPCAEKPRYTLLSVGRLSYQKNYPALIEAFAAIAGRYPEWYLEIVGEGEDRPALESLVDHLGLRGRVLMDGAVTDVKKVYRTADLFCLPSRWEGFPNTLAEAMAHGLPVVAFAGCAGMNELVASGRNGLLATGNGDPGTLSATLRVAMQDADLRGRLGREAREIVKKYRPAEVYDEWERLFQRCRRI